MLSSWMWEILNWLSVPVLALVGGILVWRRLHREYPLFLWYLIVTELATGVRFVARFRSARTYFYAYWLSDLVVGIFTFLAIYELFLRRLFPRFHRVRFYRYMFPVGASGVIILGWLMAFGSSNKTGAFLIADRVLDSVLVGMLAFFVSLMLLMGRKWTRYDFGIALGLALNTAAFLIALAVLMRTRSGAADQLSLIAFDISCLIWLYYFSTRDRFSTQSESQLDPAMLHQARSWETLLKSWLIPGKNKR